MYSNKLSQLFVVLVTLLAVGCADVEVTIEKPIDDDTVYSAFNPVDLLVTWSGEDADDEPFVARMNGLDITDMFIVEAGSARLGDNDLSSKMRDGINTFQASKGTEMPSIFPFVDAPGSKFAQVRFDKNGPDIHITEVDSEIFGDSIRVFGYLNDVSSIESMTWSNSYGSRGHVVLTDAYNNDGEKLFHVDMPALEDNVITFVAVDALGQSNEQKFYRNYTGENPGNLRHGMELRGGQEFLEGIENVLKGTVIEVENQKLFSKNLFIVKLRLNIKTIKVIITQIDISIPDDLSSDLNLWLDLFVEIDAELCLDPPLVPKLCIPIRPDIEQLLIDMVTQVVPSGNNDLRITQVGDLDIDASGIDLAFGNNIPFVGKIVDAGVNFVADTLTDLIFLIAPNIAEKIFGAAVNGVLQGLPIEFEVGLNFDHGQPYRAICMGGFYDEIVNEGDQLVFKLGMDLDVLDFPAVDPLGIRVYDFQPAEDLVGPDGEVYGAVVSISASTINQLMDGIYRAGFFHIDLENVARVHGRTYALRVIPKAPAFVSMNQFDLAMTEFHLWDLSVQIDVLIDESNPELGWEMIGTGTMNLDVPLNFFVEDNVNILSRFTEEVDTGITDVNLVAGNTITPLALAQVAYLASGPLMTLSADALSEFRQPALPVAGYQDNPPPAGFWLDAENGAFKLGLNLGVLIGDNPDNISIGLDGLPPLGCPLVGW